MRLVCALFGLLLLGAPAADAAKRKSCVPRAGEQVVVKSKRAIVTRAEDHFTGCRFSTGRRKLLVSIADRFQEDASNFVLAGDKLAFAFTTSDHNGNSRVAIQVFDTRRWRADAPVSAGANGHDSEALTFDRLSLSPRGSVAWRWTLTEYAGGPPRARQFVDYNDREGWRRLAHGESGSLRGPHFSTPSLITWTQDGERHTSATAQGCALRPGEQVVVSTARVRVTKYGDSWRGCRLATGRGFVLATEFDDLDESRQASRFAVAGDYAAFVDERRDLYDRKSATIIVADSRRWRYRQEIGVGSTEGQFDTLDVEQLALSARGFVAWRTRYENPNPERESRVESIGLGGYGGERGSARVLDSGPIGSLDGPLFDSPTHVAWTHDGDPRGADAG